MSTTQTREEREVFADTVASSATRLWAWLALLVAVVGTAGSLYLSMGMGLRACPLCFYQRTFMMAILGVLLVGLLGGTGARASVLSLLCLPSALGGAGVAAFHCYLELAGTLECPPGMFGLGTPPQQSLAAFAPLTVLLLVDVFRKQEERPNLLSSGAAVILGLLFTVGCIQSSPPLPPVPAGGYPGKFDMCRPPYRG